MAAFDELDDRHLAAMLELADDAVDLYPKMTPEQWMDYLVELVMAFVGRM